MRRMNCPTAVLCLLTIFSAGATAQTTAGRPVPGDAFPRFIVPGHQARMDRLGDLFLLHHSPRTLCTLWDSWLPMSVLWPALGEPPSAEAMRNYYRHSLLGRPMDEDGYVLTRQHRGLAHSSGWPFPTWAQAGGIGWHFSLANEAYAVWLKTPPATSLEGWQLRGIEHPRIDPDRGLVLRLTSAHATLTTPPLDVDTFVAPFIRLDWSATGLSGKARPALCWLVDEEHEFDAHRRIRFAPRLDTDGMAYTMIPAYRHPGWRGRLKRLRIDFGNRGPATVTLKSLITAVDTRHPINNSIYLHACADYFAWTTDLAFLRANMGRMRAALRWAMEEFQTRQNECVLVPWVGHDGRTGFVTTADGGKKLFAGRGVGNNYWDLLPFGHKDFLATVYFYAALVRMAELEEEIARHPQWNVPRPPPLDPAQLRRHAARIKQNANRVFWNEATGRFVACIDVDGKPHDYGYTIINLEAIHYGLASRPHARSILDWIGGRRIVPGDTSTGEDIYHWRFAPRCSTLRNVDWYVWVWNRPEDIPWGGQVQDGGAVLGFSYFDLMARLEVLGPDNAWQRLSQILDWFAEVQQGGGYRAYYAQPGRGTLQGGNIPGGLGMDQEFLESVLVPQVMLYGFLGFHPHAEGFSLSPRLPDDWPKLTVTRIAVQDSVLDVTADRESIRIDLRLRGGSPLRIRLDPGRWRLRRLDTAGNDLGKAETVTVEDAGDAFVLPGKPAVHSVVFSHVAPAATSPERP